MRSVVVAGHVCVDLIPEVAAPAAIGPGELLEVGPLAVDAGGCVANTGGDLAALGADVAVVGDAGDDELGALLVTLLRARGARTDQIRLRGGCSTSYSLVFEPAGQDRSFWHHVGANAQFDGSAVDLAGAGLLHVGYPSLLPALIADGGRPLEALLERARSAGLTTSLDLAVIDPASAAAREDWAALLERVLPLVDVLSPSLDDVRTALPVEAGADPAGLRRTARMLLGLGPAIVMLTAGAAGLQLATADEARMRDAGALLAERAGRAAEWSGQEHFTPPPPVEVRTTLAAGDAATAGLLCGLLADLDSRAALELAARAAAARVSGGPLAALRPYATGSAEPASSA
jgi:sugar/nucleoside kinase (ribokinase family)